MQSPQVVNSLECDNLPRAVNSLICWVFLSSVCWRDMAQIFSLRGERRQRVGRARKMRKGLEEGTNRKDERMWGIYL